MSKEKHLTNTYIDLILPNEVSEDELRDSIKQDGFYYSPTTDSIIVIRDKEDLVEDKVFLSETGYKIGKFAKDNNLKIVIKNELPYQLVLGLLQSNINPKEHITEDALKNTFLYLEDYIPDYIELDKKLYKELLILNKAITDTKIMINIPHNQLPFDNLISHIENYVNKTIDILNIDKSKITKNILDYGRLEREGYNLITTVGKASNNATIIHYKYKPSRVKGKYAIVGKGVHFDTGGYSLKPSDAMISMKRDKTGAITALMLFLLIAYSEAEYEVDLVLGMTENMLDSKGYKPGDVLKSKNGKTIEIINTDAEGRLVLADCLNYLSSIENGNKYDIVFSIATLTGASMRAVSKYTIAEHGYNFISGRIAELTGEVITNLASHPKLKDSIKSKIADVRNVADTNEAGSITAYLFLEEFLPNTIDFTHYDIAGPSYTDKLFKYTEYGATGCLLESLFLLLRRPPLNDYNFYYFKPFLTTTNKLEKT